MDLIERVAQALWGDPVLRPIGWDVGVKAAIRAMLDGVEPVAVHIHTCGEQTPLYSLDALKEALS